MFEFALCVYCVRPVYTISDDNEGRGTLGEGVEENLPIFFPPGLHLNFSPPLCCHEKGKM